MKDSNLKDNKIVTKEESSDKAIAKAKAIKFLNNDKIELVVDPLDKIHIDITEQEKSLITAHPQEKNKIETTIAGLHQKRRYLLNLRNEQMEKEERDNLEQSISNQRLSQADDVVDDETKLEIGKAVERHKQDVKEKLNKKPQSTDVEIKKIKAEVLERKKQRQHNKIKSLKTKENNIEIKRKTHKKVDNQVSFKPKTLILSNHQSPGDILMLTAAVRDLHKSHPNKFITAVDTSCSEIWENNPYIANIENAEAEKIEMDYPLIHRSNTAPYHFIHGFTSFLEDKLNIKIKRTDFKGDIHLSDSEKRWTSQIKTLGIEDDFWIICAGGKFDFTAKWYSPIEYQKVVDHFRGRITFVQTGQLEHWHPPLRGVINLIGKTDLRQFIRLIHHSIGVVAPVTFAMHAAAAVPVPENCGRPLNRAAVIIAGGREPVQWEAYPHHRYLSVNGALSCCDNGGCWKSRCQKVGDGDKKDTHDLCLQPVRLNKDLQIPRCMEMIKASDIIRAIEMYYEGDMLRYHSSIEKIDALEKS